MFTSSVLCFIIYLPLPFFKIYSKTCVKRLKKTKNGFQDRLLLNAGQNIAECSKGSILQNFRPSLSYQLSLRHLFRLFLSGRLHRLHIPFDVYFFSSMFQFIITASFLFLYNALTVTSFSPFNATLNQIFTLPFLFQYVPYDV